MSSADTLLEEVRACRLCAAYLPLGPRPVLQWHREARILIAGQAPGRKVHETGLPFNDPSGERLRGWLGINRETFYDERLVAIVPMGFCYPGTGASGDLPPRPECAATWRAKLLAPLAQIRLSLVIGKYAQDWHLSQDGRQAKPTLTENVASRDYWPHMAVLPHPSPRNNLWLKRNPWFEAEFVPLLRERVAQALAD